MTDETGHRLGEGLNNLEVSLVLVRSCFVVVNVLFRKVPVREWFREEVCHMCLLVTDHYLQGNLSDSTCDCM